MTNHQSHTPATAHETTSASTPRWPLWARLAIIPVLLLLPMVLAMGVLWIYTVILPPQSATDEIIGRILAGVAMTLFTIGLLALYLRLVERRRLSFAGLVFTRWSVPALALGILTSAVVQTAAALAVPATTLRPPETDEYAAAPVVLLVLLAVAQGLLLQGLPEELLFRGYLVKTLASRPWIAIATSVLAFTAIHLLSQGGQQGLGERVLYLSVPFGFAVSAVGLALLTRSLWSAIGIHAGMHFAGMVAASQGIGDGPAMWVALGTTHTLIGVIALVLWARRGTQIEYRW